MAMIILYIHLVQYQIQPMDIVGTGGKIIEQCCRMMSSQYIRHTIFGIPHGISENCIFTTLIKQICV